MRMKSPIVSNHFPVGSAGSGSGERIAATRDAGRKFPSTRAHVATAVAQTRLHGARFTKRSPPLMLVDVTALVLHSGKRKAKYASPESTWTIAAICRLASYRNWPETSSRRRTPIVKSRQAERVLSCFASGIYPPAQELKIKSELS